ncbi:MAG TPA: thiamine-phosphate kinase [Pseudolabrys sp.]|nr:thiamine-phosphate kinase [Pseudolabrys sp.]
MGAPGDSGSAEDRLIARLFKPLARHPGALGLTDDAAFITPPPGTDVVLKADAIIAGVHFFPDDPAEAVARKALRVNLSDLAAKGATPLGFLLSLAVPKDVGDVWLEAFARGLGDDAKRYACPLMGGDTDRTPGPATISIAAFGSVPQGRMVRRGGARPGDHVLVTGTIGDAALGLRVRRGQTLNVSATERAHLTERYLLPQPRNALAEALRVHANAAMDISDGLVGDFTKLCRASGATATIEVARVPLSGAAKSALAADAGLVEPILTGGDDYEVACTVAPGELAAFRNAAMSAGVPVAEIGRIAAGEGAPSFLDVNGKPLAFAHGSFSHF